MRLLSFLLIFSLLPNMAYALSSIVCPNTEKYAEQYDEEGLALCKIISENSFETYASTIRRSKLRTLPFMKRAIDEATPVAQVASWHECTRQHDFNNYSNATCFELAILILEDYGAGDIGTAMSVHVAVPDDSEHQERFRKRHLEFNPNER